MLVAAGSIAITAILAYTIHPIVIVGWIVGYFTFIFMANHPLVSMFLQLARGEIGVEDLWQRKKKTNHSSSEEWLRIPHTNTNQSVERLKKK